MGYQVPAHSDEILVSFPAEHVMLLTFNRPKSLNAMTPTMSHDIDTVLTWFDNEPSLWWVICSMFQLSVHITLYRCSSGSRSSLAQAVSFVQAQIY